MGIPVITRDLELSATWGAREDAQAAIDCVKWQEFAPFYDVDIDAWLARANGVFGAEYLTYLD